MTTKELIHAEIDTLSEDMLDELYGVIKRFMKSKRDIQKQSFMAKLKHIQIDALEDFAANIDLYISGEKHAEPQNYLSKVLHCTKPIKTKHGDWWIACHLWSCVKQG